MSKATILMIEDNAVILRTNRAQLELAGYRVLEAETLAAGKERAETEVPDLILLDILLPDGNGLNYCRELFGSDGPQILFLSALNTKEDVIAGLRAGGDDYMVKPYLMEELLARVETLLRRTKRQDWRKQNLIIGNLELRPASRRGYGRGDDLLLTANEYAILEYLIKNRHRHVGAAEIYEELWEMKAVSDVRAVWEHISRIRSKIERQTNVRIKSKRQQGYQIVVQED